MHGLLIFGLIMVVGALGGTVIALAILVIHRRVSACRPAPRANESLDGIEGQSHPPATRRLFVILAWLSAWVAAVGLGTARLMWAETDTAPTPRSLADAELGRAYQRSNAAALLATACVGVGLGTVGFCGIRSRRGAAAVLSGCALGLVLSLILIVAAIAHYVYFGNERFRGPYV